MKKLTIQEKEDANFPYEFGLSIVFLIIIFLVFSSCYTPTEKLLTDVGYKFKGQGNCVSVAEKQCAYLNSQGIKAETVYCFARDKYKRSHRICKAYINNQWWIVPDGLVMDIPWEYDEVKKYCYDFILP